MEKQRASKERCTLFSPYLLEGKIIASYSTIDPCAIRASSLNSFNNRMN